MSVDKDRDAATRFPLQSWHQISGVVRDTFHPLAMDPSMFTSQPPLLARMFL